MRAVLAATFLLLVSVGGYAQDRRPSTHPLPGRGQEMGQPGPRLMHLARALHLTRAQMPEVRHLVMRFVRARMHIQSEVQGGAMTRAEARGALQHAREHLKAGLKQVLTPEQLQKLRTILHHRRDSGPHQPPAHLPKR